MSTPLQVADLIFPVASTSVRDTLGELKRSNLTIKNRLQSIYADAQFVQRVARAYGLPLVANERCGSWYIPAAHCARDEEEGIYIKEGSVYFKSTDGHFGQWAFSLRRLNLHILDLIGSKGGCIIVDSTRKGKSMPDALSKTVPIWVTVLNRLLFPDLPESHALQTPADVVSASEHSQIESRLQQFLSQCQGLELDVSGLRSKLHGKPIAVDWLRPGDALAGETRSVHNLVVLCTASNRTSADVSDDHYVQGAADDHESWALGLDAVSFWAHNHQLRSASEDELPRLIAAIVDDGPQASHEMIPILVPPTSNLWIGNNSSAHKHALEFDVIVSCTKDPSASLGARFKNAYITLACTQGKIGSRQLRVELTKASLLSSIREASSASREPKILVTCHTGSDLAVGVALALLCRLYSPKGAYIPDDQHETNLSKDIIKHRLSWIMIAMPHAKPSRATLQSVNAYLLG